MHPSREQESVVQAKPSLQDCVPPPPVHCPAAQVIAAENARPEQDASAHWAPSFTLLQAVVSFAAEHT